MRKQLILMMLPALSAFAQAADIAPLNILRDETGSVNLTMRWADSVALDNLLEGVAINDANSPTVGSVLADALRLDPRFYALTDAEGAYVAFGFDTNGDYSAAITLDGVALTLTDGVATTDAEDYSTASGSSVYDHWQVNSDENCWVCFLNGEVTELTATVSNGDDLRIEYLPVGTTEPTELEYVFPLHPATEQGVWILPEYTIDTANGKKLSAYMIANVLGDVANLYGIRIGFEIYEPDGETSSSAYYGSATAASAGSMAFTITVSNPVDAVIRPYLNINKDWGDGKKTAKRVYGSDATVHTIVANPITSITLKDIEAGDTIELDNMGVAIISPVYEPADADFTGYTVTFDDSEMVSLYSNVNALVAHKAGTTTMHLCDKAGNEFSTYTVTVKGIDPDNKPDDDWQDGLVFLNEEWFTHTSGSLNYIDAEGNVYYRAYGNQNNNMAFGATSQFGMNYGGKYVIISKQAWDGGDTRPDPSGGRVVVFDAKTFKHIGAIDELGGDGRAAVGINPSKIYVSTSGGGVRIVDLDNVELVGDAIEGTAVSGWQLGNMVKAGKYVFVINVDKSVLIIDTTTDELVKTLTITNPDTGSTLKPQGVVQSKDGRVWVGCASSLSEIDLTTLEVVNHYSVPGAISCSSSSWRSANLMASHTANVLLWGKGNYNGNYGDLYRWNLDEVEDPSTLSPVYTHTSEILADYGYGYGSPMYDDRTDTYIFATLPGFGVSALTNWYHFVDASTGEVKHRIKLPDYWWFPSMPIAPDKYEAEILLNDELTLDVADGTQVYEASQLATDRDNLDAGISLSVTVAEAADEESVVPAEITLEDNTLTISPKASGTMTFTLQAESNGKVSYKEITLSVGDATGISSITAESNQNYNIYTTGGVKIGNTADSKRNVPSGVYILEDQNGNATKVRL